MKPVIGVMPLWDDEKESVWMLPGYLSGIEEAGGIPVILPLCQDEENLDQLFGMCDGFLLTGGHDVSPQMYGEKPLECVECCPERDAMETIILKKAIRYDKPVLGICRVIQLINACLGGTLYQDLPSQHPSSTEHHQKPPYDIPVHEVTLRQDSPLYARLGIRRLSVNSYHHQAVRTLSAQLCPMAVSDDGLIEAAYRPESRFLWAVQWHPEFSYRTDRNSAAIFRAFTEAAGTV